MAGELYFEDFSVGQELRTESYTITTEEAIAFARQYDPQYFHVDEETAKQSTYGRLIVSGWQTAAVSMRLKAGTILTRIAGGLLGLGLDNLRWPKATFPGDTLTVRITILDKRVSQSRQTHGIMKYRMETFNQDNQLAMESVTSVWVPLRPVV